MKQRIVLLLWSLFWAAVLGLVSGGACVGVRLVFRGMQWLLVRHGGLLPDAAASLSPFHRVLVPVLGGLLATGTAALASLWFARRHASARYEGYVEAVHADLGRIPLASTAWRTAASAFSVATGAAIGREGSMIQFATALTSWVGARRTMPSLTLTARVGCGVAAAVAAAYQAPMAAVLFYYEIVLSDWDWSHLPQLAVSSIVGWLVSRWLLGAGPLFAVPGHLTLQSGLWALPVALMLALLGPAYQKVIRGHRALRRLPMPLVWGSLAVGLLSLRMPYVWGNGDEALLHVLHGSILLPLLVQVLAFRLLATSASMGTGTVGGVFTPTLFAGAALGMIAAQSVHASQPLLLALVGLGALLAAVTKAPWMAAFMAVELTGQWRLLPLLLLTTLLASALARRLSPHTLYEIADPVKDPRYG